ncbi:MAG: tetratricopeptide repeat protein [candidate division KSB1 bacterium]|nr:tetratricopeptide repeat protein [candidate division KSB1 bacterium]MDZ7356090.1 tetratricopeptide repeat protein [candidate division KSB1 bacterium]
MAVSKSWFGNGLLADDALPKAGWLSNFGDTISELWIFSPLALIILISAIIILLYFYKTAEWMDKRKLLLGVALIGMFILAGNWLDRYRHREPAVKFRLMMLPVRGNASLGNSQWMAPALWRMVAQQLHRALADQAIVIVDKWTPGDLTCDSLDLGRLQQLFHVDHLLFGELTGSSSYPTLIYHLVQIPVGSVVRCDTLSLIPSQFPTIALAVCDTILHYFRLKPRSVARTIGYTSLENYRQLLEAIELYQDQKLVLAKNRIENVIANDSSLVDALVLAGKIQFSFAAAKKKNGESPADEFERTKIWLNRALTKDSSCAEAWLYLGEYYIYQQRWSMAEQMLLRAYRLQPNEPRLYLALSRLHPSRYRHLGFKNERELFERAIFFDPTYEDAYLMLSDHYLFENQRKQAIQLLERYLDINPNSVPALMALGKIYLVRNEILKIIEIYNRVLQLQPQNADAYYNLGILYYNSDDYDTAEQLLKRAIAINNHPNAHLYLAYLYEAQGNLPLAIEHLRERIRLRKGVEDEFAEEARKHLFALLHPDSSKAQSVENGK